MSSPSDTSMEALRLFETPVYLFHLPEVEPLNEALRVDLLRERGQDPGLVHSNRGGWHSTPDLAQRQAPHFVALTHLVLEHMTRALQHLGQSRGQRLPPARWGLQGWAMIMERGDYTVLHDHARADLSAVWYIDAGDSPDGDHEAGALSLIHPGRPTGPLAELLGTTFTLQPSTGTLVIFPGALQHYVHPYQGDRPRICASFNATLSF